VGKNIILKKKKCSNPLITQETSIMENPEPLQELWGEKRFRSHPGNFEP